MRVVCVSDTHCRTHHLPIPDGDILIHAGDMTMRGQDHEWERVNAWLGSLPHEHKVVIPGNHDLSFESDPHRTRAMLSEATEILIHEARKIAGLRFFGSPWSPEFCGWAFGYTKDRAWNIWNAVPGVTDVLITHGPPYGVRDQVRGGRSVGCPALRQTVDDVRPRLHVFGHIHEGAGVSDIGDTTFINAAQLDERYQPVQGPVVIDV